MKSIRRDILSRGTVGLLRYLRHVVCLVFSAVYVQSFSTNFNSSKESLLLIVCNELNYINRIKNAMIEIHVANI